jgi:four helix bundle protein
MDSRPHRKLDVWKKSMDFVKHVYQATETFPKSEIYGLSSQMRRAAVSIPSNLAEGAARKGKKEFSQYLYIAQGSISEIDTQIELSFILNFLEKNLYNDLMDELNTISKMLFGLLRSLQQKVKRER